MRSVSWWCNAAASILWLSLQPGEYHLHTRLLPSMSFSVLPSVRGKMARVTDDESPFRVTPITPHTRNPLTLIYVFALTDTPPESRTETAAAR